MSLRQILREKKREFLKACATFGGDKHAFKAYITADYRARPHDYSHEAAVLEAAEHIWEENRRSGTTEPDLFSINGVVLADTLTYPDPKSPPEPGKPQKYRKIAIEFATIHHLREDAILTMRLGAEIVTSGEDKMKLADEALRRAGGDLTKLLSTVVD